MSRWRRGLIDDLLDLTRITRGKLVLDLRDASLHGVIRDAIANVMPDMLEKDLKLAVHFCGGNPFVRCDPVRLQQVFWNILKNAAKFTEARGEIVVRTRLPSEALTGKAVAIAEISDNGIGISHGEIDRIFDAFSQGDHASKGSQHRFGGLGLGLAISRSLVELHQGKDRGVQQWNWTRLDLHGRPATPAVTADGIRIGWKRGPDEPGRRCSDRLGRPRASARAITGRSRSGDLRKPRLWRFPPPVNAIFWTRPRSGPLAGDRRRAQAVEGRVIARTSKARSNSSGSIRPDSRTTSRTVFPVE